MSKWQLWMFISNSLKNPINVLIVIIVINIIVYTFEWRLTSTSWFLQCMQLEYKTLQDSSMRIQFHHDYAITHLNRSRGRVSVTWVFLSRTEHKNDKHFPCTVLYLVTKARHERLGFEIFYRNYDTISGSLTSTCYISIYLTMLVVTGYSASQENIPYRSGKSL